MCNGYRHFEFPYENKYINPIRQIFKNFYLDSENILNEEDFLEIFEKDNELVENINIFFKETKMFEKIELKYSYIDDRKIIVPKYQKANEEMQLYISGTGVSQVLPILISLFKNKSDKLYIEQPEVGMF